MAEIDTFAVSLLEEAKRFFELAQQSADDTGSAAYLHAALLLGMCSLEAHLNAVGEELAAMSVLSAHERALLLERDVTLENGEFVVKPRLKMSRIDDRLQFLHAKFGSVIDRQNGWWPELCNALKLRNSLSHPKESAVVTTDAVRRALSAIIDALSALYRAVYKTDFPYQNCGLHSQLTF